MSTAGLNVIQRCKPLLGTFVEVTVAGECEEHRLIEWSERLFEMIAALQSQLSFHDKSSELSIFNRWALTRESREEVFEISSQLRKILALAVSLYRQSNGLYDIAVAPYLIADRQLPDHLPNTKSASGGCGDIVLDQRVVCVKRPLCVDLGGLAKGFVVDSALAQAPGDLQVTVNAGGDLRTNDWQGQTVALQYGRRASARRFYPLVNAALATSGNYHRRGHHGIINPRTGKPKKRGGSISVFAPSAMVADALTKLVWLAPVPLTKQLLNDYDAAAVVINRFGFLKAL